jgi:CRISPR-associated exonuclease Cas4
MIYPEIEPWYLQVTDLKQYAYCPRVVYYQYCLSNVRPITYKMEAGVRAQDRVQDLEQRRSLRPYGVTQGERYFHVALTSQRLGVSGQIDMVVETKENGPRRVFPVDFKLTRRKPTQHVKLQVACYGMLLEENWQAEVQEGWIYLIPVRQAVRVPLTKALRRAVENQLSEIRNMIEAERMPEATLRRSRCVDCEFRRFCNDVL